MKDTTKKKVVVMGLGYIGLPTSALIASKGVHVTGVDVNQQIVEIINKGSIHIVEPDLKGLVYVLVKDGLLRASFKPSEADVFLIGVPTPFKANHIPDLSYVEAAIKMISPYLKKGDLVIIESTSPVGTTDKFYNLIKENRPDIADDFYMAYCPERVLPGRILYELEHNDRVIGGINPESTKKAKKFYSLLNFRSKFSGKLHG